MTTAQQGVNRKSREPRSQLIGEIVWLRSLNDRLRLEAQAHAQEAKTANATIAEIYQVVTGSKGEPGNWNGAAPVKEAFDRLRALLGRAGSALDGYQGIGSGAQRQSVRDAIKKELGE